MPFQLNSRVAKQDLGPGTKKATHEAMESAIILMGELVFFGHIMVGVGKHFAFFSYCGLVVEIHPPNF